MRCISCGSNLRSYKCDYCGSLANNKSSSKIITEKMRLIDYLLNQLNYYEDPLNTVPIHIKESKIKLIKEKIKNLS
jgi:hypothetical protein